MNEVVDRWDNALSLHTGDTMDTATVRDMFEQMCDEIERLEAELEATNKRIARLEIERLEAALEAANAHIVALEPDAALGRQVRAMGVEETLRHAHDNGDVHDWYTWPRQARGEYKGPYNADTPEAALAALKEADHA